MQNSPFTEEYLKLWNSYFYPNTETFINKLDITNKEELNKVDAELSFERLTELYMNPIIGDFDKIHLCEIHKYLFQDLYDWAGKYRIIYMQKNNSYFSGVEDIDIHLTNELEEMNKEISSIRYISELPVFLARAYVNLLNIHPFREGNGRTVREFLREFVLEKTKGLPFGQYEIDWTKIDGDTIDEALPLARTFRSPIENEFRKALIKVENKSINI